MPLPNASFSEPPPPVVTTVAPPFDPAAIAGLRARFEQSTARRRRFVIASTLVALVAFGGAAKWIVDGRAPGIVDAAAKAPAAKPADTAPAVAPRMGTQAAPARPRGLARERHAAVTIADRHPR